MGAPTGALRGGPALRAGAIRLEEAPAGAAVRLVGVATRERTRSESEEDRTGGHRESRTRSKPWLSHLQAVEQSAVLIEAAVRAGVERLVWTSITNPGQDTDLSYFTGKAVVEQLVRRSGLSFAILRPACFFGGGGILIDNVAWAARRLPFMPIPDGPPYRTRPIPRRGLRRPRGRGSRIERRLHARRRRSRPAGVRRARSRGGRRHGQPGEGPAAAHSQMQVERLSRRPLRVEALPEQLCDCGRPILRRCPGKERFVLL